MTVGTQVTLLYEISRKENKQAKKQEFFVNFASLRETFCQ